LKIVQERRTGVECAEALVRAAGNATSKVMPDVDVSAEDWLSIGFPSGEVE
jgi:hypothetical protein